LTVVLVHEAGSFLTLEWVGITVMLVFQIIGGVFVLLFLAAAMTGMEGSHDH